ncbi:MAG: energy-coupling factor transporter transmembrane component T family protein [Coriobacteriia bacterium]
MKSLLDYRAGDSALHRLNPITKLFIAVAICVAAFATRSLPLLVALLGLDIALGFLAGNGRSTMVLAKNLAVVSAFLFVLQLLFVRSGTPVLLFVTDDGLRVAASVVLKIADATMPLALMLQITRFNDLTNALVSVTRLPYKYAFTITTAMRFVPVFADEMSGIMEAQSARGVEFDNKGPIAKLRLILPLCAPLIISSARKSEQIAMAAEVRGFNLRTRESAYKRYPFGAADGIALVVFVFVATAGIAL